MQLLFKVIFSANIWLIYLLDCVDSETCTFFQSGTSIVGFCENGCCTDGCCTPAQPLSVAIIAVIVIVIAILIILVLVAVLCWFKYKWAGPSKKETSPVEMQEVSRKNEERPPYYRENTFIGRPSERKTNKQVHFDNYLNIEETTLSIIST